MGETMRFFTLLCLCCDVTLKLRIELFYDLLAIPLPYRFRFYCCGIVGIQTGSCAETGYINNWDAVMDWSVGGSHYIRGFYSYHDNGRE